MSDRGLYAGIAIVAAAAGTAFWLLGRTASGPQPTPATLGPAALYAATYQDLEGRSQALGQYQGRLLLLNFWATWCAPCREEMPALSEAARKWQARGVTVVGLSNEAPEIVKRFAASDAVSYPLGTGEGVDELGRRLGDTAGVLPYSALISADGQVLVQKVGPYTAPELDALLSRFTANSR